jgi:RNA recognition motif-containing protein
MDTTFLIIDGLPLSFSSSELTALLSQFGPVVQCFIVTDPLGTSLGFGYAELESQEAVDRAISTLMGKNIRGGYSLLLERALPSALVAAKHHLYPVSH